jgi:hypothetical protein
MFGSVSPAATMVFSPIVTPYVSVIVVGDFFLYLPIVTEFKNILQR